MNSRILILCLFVWVGCETSPRSIGHGDRVSDEIDRLRAESERAASSGDNIKIVVRMLSTSQSDHFAVESLFHYVDKNVVVTKHPEVRARSGLQVGVAGDNFNARLDITKRQLTSSEESELFLVLADGTTGTIHIGREIAVPHFVYMGRRYSGVAYDFRQAGRTLKVTVRKLASGQIDMELTPVFSRFLSDGGDLELTELSTRVTARSGQTLVIGGGDSSGENVAKALLGFSNQGVERRTLLTVTPYVN